MGNRRTDPWSQDLQPICDSSPGWPEFKRVLPVLDWSYSQVWAFLLHFDLSFCHLYSEGYSSLGEIHNTQKNPYLKRTRKLDDGSEEEFFLPAWELENGEWERFSRRT
mmetsp:Transcript_10732/g.16323  ORF Transcript_10732/g.16323 Transcript_10732/m.16323 type:complete len:108 (+) Transcript_10732:579-902(+)